jgi:hypothetical protein
MEFVEDQPLQLPLIPHRKTGVQCDGSIVALRDGEQITLQCNVCEAVMGTVHAELLKALEQAIADSIVIHKFTEAEAPQVLTSLSEQCQREECKQCSGVFHRPVFCVHSCHRVERHPEAVQ